MYFSQLTIQRLSDKVLWITLTLIVTLSFSSCSDRITVAKVKNTYPNGISSDDTQNFQRQQQQQGAGQTGGKNPPSNEELAGDKLRDYVRSEYITNIRKKANKSERSARQAGAVTTGIGVLGTGISGLISENKHQKYLSLSVSSLITLTGIIQIFKGVNSDYKLFLSDLETAITNWDISTKNSDSYRAFRAAIGAVMAKYGDLYEEEK